MNIFSWWGHLPYEHPGLWEALNNWPFTVFLPFISIAVLVLATVTRFSDARDPRQAARRQRAHWNASMERSRSE